MPLEPIDSLGGFTASPGLPLQREEGGDTALATVGKVAAPLAIGAGLLLAPEFTIPALVAGGAAASYADPEAAGAAFRTENTIGSVLSSDEMGVDDRRIDPQFDPWAEIQGTPYEAYYEQFGRAANRGHFDAIKSDIDRENKDRDTLAKSGVVGMGATMAAGVLDLPSLIPGAVVLRSAKGGVSMLKSAAGTAAAGTGAAVASETVLQQSQQLRTAGESATVIAGSAVLSGLLGAGLGRRISRQEFDGLAARVERDFTVPGPGEPDPFMPGSFKPSVEAVAGASEKARSVADAIRETAEEILPAQVRVQVVDSLGPVGDDGLFGLRAKRYTAPEIEAPDQIGDALKAMRATVEDAGTAPLTGRFAPADLQQRFIAYKKADTDLRAALIGGLDEQDALARYAKLRGEAEAIVNDMRKTDARINRDIEKDMKAREGKGELFSIRAFHGTPHDFDRFDLSKIGTGEGAQVFGHGLYFAENETVAKGYREALSGHIVGGKDTGLRSAERTWAKVKEEGRLEEEIARQRAFIQKILNDSELTPERATALNKQLSELELMEHVQKAEVTLGGRLYEVEIDVEPHQLLDWDAPLSEQSTIAQRLIPIFRSIDKDPYSGEPVKLTDAEIVDLMTTATGRTVVEDLAASFGKQKATDVLREAGIPGIRYFDQGSRDAGNGTRNIVIFDDSLVKITKKNGEPVTAAERQEAVDAMFGLRKAEGSPAPIAEGRFDPETLLITIAADALDPAKTLRHESIHALKSMGLFTGKDWGTLEAAAKKGGWLETHNVRALYEGVYSKQGASRFSFAGPKADNADLKALARAKTMSKAGSTREAIWQETGWFQGVDKKWRFEISDAEASVAARAGSLGDVLDHPELKEAYPSLIKNTRVENTGTPGEGGLFMSPGLDRPKIIRAIDRLTGYQPNRIALDRDAGKSTLLHEVQHGIQEREGFHPGGDFGDPLYHRRAGEVEARNVQRRMAMTPEERRATPPWKTQDVADEAQILGKSLFSLRGEGKAPSGASNPKLEALLLEEAIAEQFSLWRQGAIQVKGTIAKLFERIQQFLEATGNALRGRGFQTADDVFAAVRSGEVASRAPGASPAAGAIPAAGLGRATSAGASAVERADDTLKTALGLEKAFYWQDPMLRLQNSLSPASKRHVQELAETPLAYDKNELGEPTAPGGSEMGAPGAVETRIKFWQGALADAVQAVDQGFMKYRTGHAKRFTGETVLLNMRDTVYGTDALTYPQFKQEIAKALRRGDEHQIPEVAGAARIWRQKVLDPLKDEAIEHEMLPEGVTPETAPSYLNRLYNKDKIIAERDQFKTIVADWLEGQESINRGVRIKVAPLLERRKILEERVAKYERQIERRSAATAKIAARRQEASGLNRFAYSRAQKLSEPIDQVRGEIDTIASSIRTQLDRIEELSAAIREEKLNLPEIATVERQSIKIGHALADLKRDAALIDMVEAAESIEKPLAELYEASSGIMGALREQAKFARMTPQAQALVALEKDRAKLGRKIAPFRKKLRDLRTLQQKMEKARTPGARGGAVFESKIRSRVNTLADQEAGKKAAIEDLQMKLDRAQDELNVVTSKLEAEITAYQGKTAGDAKGAIKRRDTAEAARTPEQRAKKARLGSADKAVVTTARKIAAQLDKEPGEITALADEIIDRILGTPDGRLPYDAHKNSATAHGASVDARGPLAARQFMIPDAAIERYLENDIEVLGRAYVRTMSADVEMTKRFGSVDMVDQIKEIAEDYARLSAQAKTPEARRKLHKQRDNDIRDLAAIRDRMRGTYALPKNPDGLLVRSGRVINSLNYMRMLGGMTISAIPDTARTVMVHGLMRTAGDGLLPLLRNWSGARLAMTEVKLAGTALDMVLDSRAMQIADIMDDFGRHSKFERAIQAGARNFGVISLMAPWNAAMKQFSGLVTMTRMLRAVERIAAGKGRPKEVAMLAAGGISEANARKIAAQFAKHGSKEGGVWHANTAAWEERSAIEAFRAALVRDVDRIIVTPGQERPLWMSTETGRLIGQFKSFSISAMQRVLISGLQQRDMATLNGAILMVALGGLASVLRAKIGGQPLPDLSDGQKQGQFLVEAIDRSGLTGWMMEANSMTEKLTRGAVGLSAVTGKPVSRYASRNISSALLGPTAGTMQDFTRVVGAAASGEWNQSDSRVMRRLIPYNNIFYLRQMFDEAEAGINGFFGVPKPAGAKR
jgi:hypothetical protein